MVSRTCDPPEQEVPDSNVVVAELRILGRRNRAGRSRRAGGVGRAADVAWDQQLDSPEANSMDFPNEFSGETHDLLARLRAFYFPGGEDYGRSVAAVRTREKGEMRASPGARWLPFTADQVIEARTSSFRWEACYHGGNGVRNV